MSMDTQPITDTTGRPVETAGPAAVRRATTADAHAVTMTLASAFQDDPVFAWCIADPRTRKRHLPAWFRVVVDALLTHDDTWCTGDAAATALWVPAGAAPMTEEQESHLGEVMADIGNLELGRFAALIELMEVRHPHDPHHYLWFLAVDARLQGRGLGRRLLESRLASADDHAVPTYLEATSPRNRALYERLGFEVTGELSVDGSPPMWPMWRDAR